MRAIPIPDGEHRITEPIDKSGLARLLRMPVSQKSEDFIKGGHAYCTIEKIRRAESLLGTFPTTESMDDNEVVCVVGRLILGNRSYFAWGTYDPDTDTGFASIPESLT